MASTLTLTGCLSKAPDRVFVAAPVVAKYHPPLPKEIVLEDEKFVVCPHEDPKVFVCMDYENAAKVARNKTKIAGYVKESRTIIRFYQDQSK
jgi:hypothetical protein